MEADAGVRYVFVVAEPMSATALAAFPELTSKQETVGTLLYGPVRDQAHLHGVLSRLEALGLTLVELRQLPD